MLGNWLPDLLIANLFTATEHPLLPNTQGKQGTPRSPIHREETGTREGNGTRQGHRVGTGWSWVGGFAS